MSPVEYSEPPHWTPTPWSPATRSQPAPHMGLWDNTPSHLAFFSSHAFLTLWLLTAYISISPVCPYRCCNVKAEGTATQHLALLAVWASEALWGHGDTFLTAVTWTMCLVHHWPLKLVWRQTGIPTILCDVWLQEQLATLGEGHVAGDSQSEGGEGGKGRGREGAPASWHTALTEKQESWWI